MLDLHHKSVISKNSDILLKMKNRKDEESIAFVARSWRQNAFVPRGLPFTGVGGFWNRRPAVAAAIAGIVALGALAALYFGEIFVPEKEAPVAVDTQVPAVDGNGVARVEFTDVPLTDAIAQIESVYGVKIAGKSTIQSTMRVSLSWEGNVEELIETINNMFGIELSVDGK